MRIAFHHAAIHERAGIALVAIADHVLHVARRLGNRAPLQAGGISAAAAPAQAALGDPVDHAIRRHFGQRRQQRLVAVARNVVVDLFGIDVARILQHHANLLVEVLVQIALQFRHRLVAEAVDDRLRIRRLHLRVERLVGINAHQRSRRAGPHAAGFANQDLLAGGLRELHQRVAQLSRALARACQVHADIHFVVVLGVFLLNAFGYLFQFFNCHSTAHLSSCCDHLLVCYLARNFAVADHHWRAAAGADAARGHQADLAVLRRLALLSPRCFSADAISLSVPLM